MEKYEAMARRVLNRRDFLRSGLVAVGAAALGPAMWQKALAAPAQTGPSPYGPLNPADENGLELPDGFTSRVVAEGLLPVAGTTYAWHMFPDGGATYPTADGGWIYVSNSEFPPPVGPVGAATLGGASSIRFAADGEIVDAYRILSGTAANCGGGPTPWGTWLSCEEHPAGRVWECDPFGEKPARALPALGVFQHEAAAIDPPTGRVYMTEDVGDGVFYRFTPAAPGSLDEGVLECAQVDDLAAVTGGGTSGVMWHEVPDPSGAAVPTRNQVPVATRFAGGEGTWFDAGIVYFTTKGDNRVWAYDTAASTLELLYDDNLTTPILTGVDNVHVSAASGDVLVAEDGGDLDIVMITPDRVVARLLKLTGRQHTQSEIAGPALSPDNRRLYFSSQRAFGRGMTFEVTGPFRTTR